MPEAERDDALLQLKAVAETYAKREAVELKLEDELVEARPGTLLMVDADGVVRIMGVPTKLPPKADNGG